MLLTRLLTTIQMLIGTPTRKVDRKPGNRAVTVAPGGIAPRVQGMLPIRPPLSRGSPQRRGDVMADKAPTTPGSPAMFPIWDDEASRGEIRGEGMK
jgi:hypothetical protein